MKFLAIGEIIFDIFNGEAEIGGAPLNFCAHSAANGAESAIISAVGEDNLAEEAIKHLKKLNVADFFVQKNTFATGQCFVTIDNGIPEYNVLRPAAYDKIEITDDITNKIREYNADVFAFGTLIQRDNVSRNAVRKILASCEFPEIFCDINLRENCYDRESCLRCLANASILKLSNEEEQLLDKFGFYEKSGDEKETVRNICKSFNNIKLVLFTKGENGSLIFDAQNNMFYDIPSVKTKVISTVGAGDSYSAAFLCEYLKSGDIKKAGTAGARLSSYVVAHREAVPERKGEA